MILYSVTSMRQITHTFFFTNCDGLVNLELYILCQASNNIPSKHCKAVFHSFNSLAVVYSISSV